MTYEEISLGWRPDNRRDTIFSFMVVLLLAAFLAAGLFASQVKLPKETQDRRIPIPERIARYINERPKPKVLPAPKQEELPKPLPIPKQFVKPRDKEVHKPLTKVQKSARDKAKKSGLLALTKQLSDLVDTTAVDKMVGNRIHRRGDLHSAANVSSKVLTANTGKGHISVSQNIHSTGVGTGTVLDNDQRQLARRLLAAHGEFAQAGKPARHDTDQSNVRGDNLRSEEDVAYVMDEHKSMLHMLYRRARRSHPGLKGKIVFEITILPSGKVSKIRIISSELHDKSLEADLEARIRQFDFGSRPVEALTVTVPVEFLPS